MLRRVSSVTEASGSSASEHVEERGEREISKAVLFVLSSTSLNMPTVAVPIRLFLWGVAPPRTASFACPRHLIFNLSHERHTYRPLIRAVIIHYDAKV